MLNRPKSPPFLSSFGHYQVLSHSLLGKGFNSSVYEGVNTITGQHVCIKRISLNNSIQHLLFLNEVSCLKAIQHENVLRYRHHFQISNYAYIVTELCQENLFTRIFKKGKLEQTQALSLFLQILNGYEEIRHKDFLHRDLKPQNIFFKDGLLKIGDLGFCLRLRTSEIKEMYNVGSPLYMAPEVLASNIYSEKSDIWSLGILLYEMLHGKNPFQSKWEKDLIEEMKRSAIKYDCHPILEKIIKGALVYSKENRLDLKGLKQAIMDFWLRDSETEETNTKRLQNLIANEIRYVKFMEYIKVISSKCRKQFRNERIYYVFEYCIRMRLSLIEKLLQDSPEISSLFDDELAALKANHFQELRAPAGLTEGDRLRFLNPQKTNFDYFALWQIQAEIKDTLTQILRNCPKLNSEAEVAKNEDQLRLIDFLVTAFILNKQLIQTENNIEQFLAASPLSLILSRPQHFNLQVYRAIKIKCSSLHLL